MITKAQIKDLKHRCLGSVWIVKANEWKMFIISLLLSECWLLVIHNNL